MPTSEFKTVLSNGELNQKMFGFLQNIYRLFPEEKFHKLLIDRTSSGSSDEDIYTGVQKGLSKIKPFLSELTYALPSLKKQKKEMSNQVLKMLDGRVHFNGYLEIGSTGRYISELRKHIDLTGSIYITNDIAPNNSIPEIFERGQFSKLGKFIPLDNYQPISENEIPTASVDLVTCHIGLHHCPPDLLDGYIRSIHRILRKDGFFIMRDHDVKSNDMAEFVSLVHTVFNLGLYVPWEVESKEFKSFKSIEEWSRIIGSYGFRDTGKRILQANDPSENTLIAFIKES